MLATSWSLAAAADIPALEDVPEDLVVRHASFVQQRQGIESELRKFLVAAEAFNAKSADDQTDEEHDRLTTWRDTLVARITAFNDELSSALGAVLASLATRSDLSEAERARLRGLRKKIYTPGGDALVGGTGWITGYAVPPGPSGDAIRAKACAAVGHHAELGGKSYDVDCGRYEFALGIAASHDDVKDLRERVFFDNLRNGKASRAWQEGYNALKGRQFDSLDCHSNGAMVCLAAVSSGDIVADRVVLLGPQLTEESLRMWDEQIRNGNVASVEIVVNRDDPIPAVALTADALARGRQVLPWTDSKVLAIYVSSTAPRLAVTTPACEDQGLFDVACHSMKAYRASYYGCRSTTTGEAVPGTKARGQSAKEPPAC